MAWKQKIYAREKYIYGQAASGQPYLVINDTHTIGKVDLSSFEGSTPWEFFPTQGPFLNGWVYATYSHSDRPDKWYFITSDYDTGWYAFYEFDGRTGTQRSIQFENVPVYGYPFDQTGVALENFGMRSNTSQWYEDAWAHDEGFHTVYLVSYNGDGMSLNWSEVAVIDIDNWTIEFHMEVSLPAGVMDGAALSNLVILEGELYAWDPVNGQSVKFNGTNAWVSAAYPWATANAPSFSTFESGPKILSPYQASGGYVTADRLYYKDYFSGVGNPSFGPHIAWWDVGGFHYAECPWPTGYDTGDGLDAKGMVKVGSKYVFVTEQGWDCVCVFDPSTDTLSAFSTGIPVNWAETILIQIAPWDSSHVVIVVLQVGAGYGNATPDNAKIAYYVMNVDTGAIVQEAGPEFVIATDNEIDYGLHTMLPFAWSSNTPNGWELLIVAPESASFVTETGIAKTPYDTGVVGQIPDPVPPANNSSSGTPFGDSTEASASNGFHIIVGDDGRVEFYSGDIIYITIP